jgi:hypothetical protein
VALLAVAGLIACKDAGLLDAFSCPWTPPSTFYKLLEIERPDQSHTPLLSLCASTCCTASCCTLDCETGCCTPLGVFHLLRPHTTHCALRGICCTSLLRRRCLLPSAPHRLCPLQHGLLERTDVDGEPLFELFLRLPVLHTERG